MFPFIIVKNAIYTLIFMNLDNNHKNATEKELYKIKHLLRVKLIPELDNKLKTNTVEDIIEDHPEMDKIIRKRKEISKELELWAKENRLDEYAEQLDVFIEKRKLDLNNSIALINNPKITVTDVAKELNINRSTIHRNKELTDRIEKANEELLAIKNKTGNLNEHIKMLEHEIELLKKREQDYMLLKESYNQLVDAFTNSN